MKKLILFTTTVFLLLGFGVVFAHPGKTDKRGGHFCRTKCAKWGLKTGSYHFHVRKKTPKKKSKKSSKKLTRAMRGFYKVIYVVDGDTVDVMISGRKSRLRLIGMDTPETKDPRKPVQCFGREASAKAKTLLLNKGVWVVSDPSQGTRDKYGRLLRYIFLKDKTNFNKSMIENGYAHEYTYNTPYKYQTTFKQAERSARAEGRGLWNPKTCAGRN